MWLDRDLIKGPYLSLCKTEKEFKKVLKHIGVKEHVDFINPGEFHACTHAYRKNGKLICIVCVSGTRGKTREQIYALLVHEAVHVWQDFCSDIRENNPSSEFEAYSIQTISQRLFIAFSATAARTISR